MGSTRLLLAFLATLQLADTAEPLPFSCGFEEDFCGMEQDVASEEAWRRHTGRTLSASTGPDQASHGSYYIYMEGTEQTKAVISTPPLTHSGHMCVRFHYSKYGQHINSFNVFLESQRQGSPIWEETGEDTNTGWHSAAISVNTFTENDGVTFISQSDGMDAEGPLAFADTAIDDLRITAGECNACDVNNGGCDHICNKDDDGMRCDCNAGYRLDGDGRRCFDVDECSGGTSGCSHGCDNSPGGYSCSCPGGYNLMQDQNTCEDIDECSAGTHNCADTCDNTVGSFRCVCRVGYEKTDNSQTCTDTDECQVGGHGCHSNELCENTDGSYTCSCPDGFNLRGDGRTCSDATTVPPNSTPPGASQDQGESDAAAIAGGVVGGLVAIAIIVVIVIVLIRKKKQSSAGDEENPSPAWKRFPFHKLGNNKKPASPTYINEDIIPREQPDVVPSPVPQDAVRATKPSKPAKPARPTVPSSKPDIPSEPAGGMTSARSMDSLESIGKDLDTDDDLSGSPEATADMLKRVPCDQFADFVSAKRLGEIFKTEFKTLPGQVHESSEAKRNGLKVKNRFINILPYDKNRVKLRPLENQPLSDYINASFIELYEKDEVFIASHGPTKQTINDLWRMIWEQKVELVVMLTNCVENGKMKCEQYWPDEEPQVYGSVSVRRVTEEKWPNFVVRTLYAELKTGTSGSRGRTIKQLQFTTWPDHGVPGDVTEMLRFHKRMRRAMKPGKPTMIHCSAGVGRTGTLMALDYLLHQVEEEETLGVYECVQHLRGQRKNMVQSLKQYIFIHDTMLEMVSLGDTSIECAHFRSSVNDRRMATEFKVLEDGKPEMTQDDKTLALSKENEAKNFSPEIIPRIPKRAFLTSRVKGRNDYINAVFVHSHRNKDAFIATQTPLASTRIDFWRLIHDNRCRSIVILDTEIGDLLPGEELEELSLEPYHIMATSQPETKTDELACHDVTVSKGSSAARGDVNQNEYTNKAAADDLRCRVFHARMDTYRSLTPTFLSQLSGLVRDWQIQGSHTATLVVSRDGAEVCGAAIAFFCLLEKMNEEPEVDVFHVVKQIKESRPEFISCLQQYRHLYSLTGDYLEQFMDYQNFK